MAKQSFEEMKEQGVWKKTTLQASKFAQIVSENDITYDDTTINDNHDVQLFFEASSKDVLLQWKRDVFGDCLDLCGIAHGKMDNVLLESSKDVKEWFFRVFDVVPKNPAFSASEDAAESSDAEAAVAPAPATTKTASETSSETDVDAPAVEWGRVFRESRQLTPPANMDCTTYTLYDHLPITAQDAFYLTHAPADVYLGAVALMRGDTVAAEGHLVAAKGDLHIVCHARDIRYTQFDGTQKFTLLMLKASSLRAVQAGDYGNASAYRKEIRIQFSKLPVAESRTLCIDFGTSNTTAGSYGIPIDDPGRPGMKVTPEGPEIVQFPTAQYHDDGSAVLMDMMPTIAYILSCKEGEPVRYLFGYEAKAVIERDFQPQATVFYELKRWLSTMDDWEDIMDADGRTGRVQHKAVIQAYIQYVIDCASQYFKRSFACLHFSAPVKLKANFIRQMQAMFQPDYEVYPVDKSLDEGVAIVYDHIASTSKAAAAQKGIVLSKTKPKNDESILIMDCGGGTTDLAQCHYGFEKNPVTHARILHIRTRFENGESNFGGNNVTYRILQMLKIKIAARMQGKEVPKIQELIQLTDDALMFEIDKDPIHALDTLYDSFEKRYQEAEAVLPTRFNETKLQTEIEHRRRNFLYLWYLAETIKIEFYKAANIVEMDFDDMEDHELQACIDDKQNYYLYGADGQSIDEPLQGIHITIKEVERAICPDLYALLNKLLTGQGPKRMEELVASTWYKLSGQSCKITMFHNLLKEFVAGRKIRRTNNQEGGTQQDRFKVSCVAGSIQYMEDLANDRVNPDFRVENPQLIYQVFQDETKALYLADSEDGGDDAQQIVSTVIPKGSAASRANFCVVYEWKFDDNRPSQYEEKRTITYTFAQDAEHRTSIDLAQLQAEITKRSYIGNTAAHAICKAVEQAKDPGDHALRLLFLVPDNSGYGFLIYQVLKEWKDDDTIDFTLEDTPHFESFEDEHLESFFNGER